MGPLERLAISRQEEGEASPHINATRLDKGGVEITPSAAELNALLGITSSPAELNILTGVTATAAELNKTDGVVGGLVESQEVFFTENATNTVHTGNITIPAGATILDITVHSVALWTATSASLEVGVVSDDDDGFFTAVDLKATDLLAGESINLGKTGGVHGAYFITDEWEHLYNVSSRVVRCTIAVGTPATTAGRTRVVVTYVVPTSVAATESGP